MKTKRHGWVRQENKTGKFVKSSGRVTKTIRKALVFATREEARDDDSVVYRLSREDTWFNSNIDIPRKVSLTRTGKAKCILPGR
jgi:hypothetical protein